MFRFLHAADLHLDSPLRGLARYEGAPVEEVRGATRRALENLVALAIDEQVAFVLFAGDIYDGDWKDYNTGLFFIGQMRRLREAGIGVYLISGNHDAENKMTRELRSLGDVATMLSSTKPQSVQVSEDPNVWIHGRGFSTQAENDSLVLDYPPGKAGAFNIGLLHTSLEGPSEHIRYAPCSLDDLRTRGYQYWALGHVHNRRVVCETDPTVVFPGNVQGRHIRETGPKGCVLVTVDDAQQASVEFQPLDVFRWESCEVAMEKVESDDDVLQAIRTALAQSLDAAEGRPLAVRVVLTGACPLHRQLLAAEEDWIGQVRATALEVAGGSIWIEQVKFHTTPPKALDLENQSGPVASLLEYLGELRGDDEQLGQIGGQYLDDLHRKLANTELTKADFTDEPLRLDDVAWIRDRLGDVESLLIERLLAAQEVR